MTRILFAIAIAALPLCTIAQEKQTEKRHIKVMGHAEQNFEPGYVDVQINLNDKEKINNENAVAKKEEELIAFLKANGIPESKLRVQRINTSEAYSMFGSKYYINKNYTLRIEDLKKYESIIIGLVERGFKNLYISEIGITDREQKADEVMAAAVKNGTNKANIIAAAANVKNLRLLSVDETIGGGGYPVMYNKMANFAADAGASNIPLGKINIQKDLTMIYEIE